MLGLGNSLFHVWGGKQEALLTRNDIRALGMSVSTGAMGLAIGVVLASWILLYGLLAAIALMAVLATHNTDTILDESPDSEVDVPRNARWTWCAALLLMVFVCLRSYLGEALSADLTKGASMILLIGGIAMLGKGLDGWVAKGIGLWLTLLLALAGNTHNAGWRGNY